MRPTRTRLAGCPGRYGGAAAASPSGDLAHQVGVPAHAVRVEAGAGRENAPRIEAGERHSVVRLPGDLGPELGPRFALADRSEEHTSELQSLMRTSYAVFCL